MVNLLQNYTKLMIYSTLMLSFHSQAGNKVVFTSGASSHAYQPRVIVPILSEAFKRNGIEFHDVYHPSLRSLALSNAGKLDGELHRVYDFHKVSMGKYPNLVRIESQLLSVWLAAFATKDITITNWESLKGYRVAFYRGRKDIELTLKNVLAPGLINRVNTDEQAFSMLATGRVDIVISDSLQGKMLVKVHEKFAKIIEVAKIEEVKIYAYMHTKHQNMVSKIAKTLNVMKKDGSFWEIVDQESLRFRRNIK